MSQYLAPDVDRLRRTIRHVVVLMLENRSFDNLLGWLYDDAPPYDRPPDGQHFEGLTPGLWNPLANIDPDGVPFVEKVPVRKNGAPIEHHGKPVATRADFTLPSPDPGEGYRNTNFQLFGGYQVAESYAPPPVNTGFVDNYQRAMMYGTYGFGDAPTDPRAIMTCYTPAQTPVLSALARGYAVCDHYHCSVPSQTIPNRDFVHAATSTGHVNNHPVATCDAPTIFNQLQDAIDGGRDDLSWGVFGSNLLAGHADLAGAFGGDHFSLTRLIMTRLHDRRFDGNFGTLADFADRCAKGALPSYAFLEPSYGGPGQNDQHPPADIRPGEQLIADVYGWIAASPAFAETLFVITYDEHGGCYDHVPPPGGAKNPDPAGQPGQDGFAFDRFGVRVPCVVVNPHIKRGLVARPAGRTPFDHTSIIRTVQQCFGLTGSLTARDAAAPDLSGLLSLDQPRTDDLPVVAPPAPPPAPAPPADNDLHRTLAAHLAATTGATPPESGDLSAFIQRAYVAMFGSSS